MASLLFGLGNPGSRYEATRHNVGFMLLDRLPRRLDDGPGEPEPFRLVRDFEADICRAGPVRLIKPQTFMNLSGRAVARVCHFFKIAPADILVIHDDVDLPLGVLRFRARGSGGGHNGVGDIIACLGTGDFPRLKIGIGRSERADTVGHVLGKFAPEERSEVDEVLERACDAVEVFLRDGIDRAMNLFHTRPPRKSSGSADDEVPSQ